LSTSRKVPQSPPPMMTTRLARARGKRYRIEIIWGYRNFSRVELIVKAEKTID
jgi:hypothetical protein